MSLLSRGIATAGKPNGFTLLEVMIVLVLVATMSGYMISRLADPSRDIKRFVTKFSLVTRQIQYQAKLYSTTYRLVIDLDEDAIEGIPQRYWVEKSTDSGIVLENEPLEQAAEDEPQPTSFEKDDKIFREIQGFPNGLKVTQVELTRRKEPIVNGKAYVYFLPQGLVDEAAIHLSYGENTQWTIITNPLSGQSDLVPKFLSLQEVRSQ